MPTNAATQPPPADAFRFRVDASSPVKFADSGTGPRRFNGVAYSGGVITGHWYWDAVIFDLSSTRAPDRTPALIEHDRTRRAGFCALNNTGAAIEVADGTLLDNTHGREVGDDSRAGFPWQMSVHIDPGRIERVEAGKSVTVNGRAVQGPCTIFRDSLIREVSFVATGADPDTSASAFSRHSPQATEIPAMSGTANTNDSERVAALEAKLAGLEQQFTASLKTAIADAVKPIADQFSAMQAERTAAGVAAREASIDALAKDLGRTFSADQRKAYAEMSETQFSTVAADLRANRPQLPATAFGHVATQGAEITPMDDVNKFSAAVQAEIAAAKARGENPNPVAAAATVRARAQAQA